MHSKFGAQSENFGVQHYPDLAHASATLGRLGHFYVDIHHILLANGYTSIHGFGQGPLAGFFLARLAPPKCFSPLKVVLFWGHKLLDFGVLVDFEGARKGFSNFLD